MKKTTLGIMLLSGIQMLASYGQRMLLAYYFGATVELDRYFLCLTIPNTLVFFFKALGTSASPVGTKFEESDNPGASRQLWGGLFWLAIGVLARPYRRSFRGCRGLAVASAPGHLQDGGG